MTIVHRKRQPPTYNAVQWTGENQEEIETALNTNLFRVDQNFSQRLLIRDKFTNNQVASVPIGSWIISTPYNGPVTDQFGIELEIMEDEEFQLEFPESAS